MHVGIAVAAPPLCIAGHNGTGSAAKPAPRYCCPAPPLSIAGHNDTAKPAPQFAAYNGTKSVLAAIT